MSTACNDDRCARWLRRCPTCQYQPLMPRWVPWALQPYWLRRGLRRRGAA